MESVWLELTALSCADTAYTLDRRIKKFKEAEKAEKEARKKAKVEAARLEAMERERVSCYMYVT